MLKGQPESMNFGKFFFSRNRSKRSTHKEIGTLSDDESFFFLFFYYPSNCTNLGLFNTKVQSRILLASVYGPFEIYTFFTRVTRCMQQRTRPKNTPQDVGEDGSFVRNSPRRSIDNETLPPHSPWNTY